MVFRWENFKWWGREGKRGLGWLLSDEGRTDSQDLPALAS